MPQKMHFNCLRNPTISPTSRPLIIPVFIPHAGCPHHCVFCNQHAITGGNVRIPSGTDIVQTVESYLRHACPNRSPVEIAFYGGNFLGLSSSTIESLLNTVHPFIRQGNVHNLRCSTRPDTISSKTLDTLTGFPFSVIEIGVQSMDDSVLDLSQRGHTAHHTRAAITQIKACGYRVGVQLMVGLPGDSPTGAIATAMHIADLEPDFVRIYPTLVFRGSLLEKWYHEGRYASLSLEQAVKLVKSMYRVFQRREIPVIRMGLQPTESLMQSGEILAGPFHPAFGHLVIAAHFREQMCEILNGWPSIPPVIQIQVHPRNASPIRGHKNETFFYLKHRYRIRHIHLVLDNSVSAGHIAITPGVPGQENQPGILNRDVP